MTDLEQKLRTEETSVLQDKLRNSAFIEEAAAIAERILVERDASVPTPRYDVETEAIERQAMKRSTIKAGAVVLWIGLVWLFKLYEPDQQRYLLASALPVAALVGLYRVR